MKSIGDFSVTKIHSAAVVALKTGASFKKTDRKCYAVCFAESGKCVYTQAKNGKSFVSDGAHALIFPRGADYTMNCMEGGTFPIIDFEADDDCLLTDFAEIKLDNTKEFLSNFYEIKRLLFFRKGHSHLGSMRIMYNILERLYYLSVPENDRKSYDIIRPAVAFLEENYTDPALTNTVLAGKAYISDAYFRRVFRKKYGISPKAHIRRLRICRARELLEEKQLSVAGVAEASGFSSIYHFSRAFKHETGYSPSEYAGIYSCEP